MKFDVPARMAMPGSEIHVKLAGLDPHDNELVTTEGHVAIAQGTGAAGIVAADAHTSDDRNKRRKRKKGGFGRARSRTSSEGWCSSELASVFTLQHDLATT